MEGAEFLEEVAASERRSIDLQQLEQLAVKLMEAEKMIEECKGKLSDAEKAVAEFKQKSGLEKRFSDLAGLPYTNKSAELEEKAKTFKAQLESLSAERLKLYGEILTDLSNAIIPLENDGPSQVSEDEAFFKFRDGKKYPAIAAFVKRKLKFGRPPVYVTIFPDGMKVAGVDDKLSAMKELINAVESLRAKATGELGHHRAEGLSEEPSTEKTPSKGFLAPLRRLGKQ
jgi:hypothetical protein